MPEAAVMLETYFLEMRWRCLSLAADLDRIERAGGGPTLISNSPQIAKLFAALKELQSPHDRAERVQMIFSDVTPPPR